MSNPADDIYRALDQRWEPRPLILSRSEWFAFREATVRHVVKFRAMGHRTAIEREIEAATVEWLEEP